MRTFVRVIVAGSMIVMGAVYAPAQQEAQKTAVPAGVLYQLNQGKIEYKEAELQAYAVDLNGDGTPEIVLMGKARSRLCSGSGNCSFWAFERDASGYSELFRQSKDDWPYGRDAADWKVLESVHEGYRDLQLIYRDTPITATATSYEMHEGKYEYSPGSCAALTYGYFEEGKFHAYDPPKSERCGAGKSTR